MSVTVILPDNKRINVKVTSSSLLSEVLEKACTYKGLDSGTHTLRRGNRALDICLSLRLANIPLNSELNLIYDGSKSVDQQVSVSIQYEDRQRKTGQFAPSQTLWHVIVNLFEQDCPEIRDNDIVLSINFMNRQFEGKDVLANTTLQLMGIVNGRVMLRMNSRTKESKIEQKFVENIQRKIIESEKKDLKSIEKAVVPDPVATKESRPETSERPNDMPHNHAVPDTAVSHEIETPNVELENKAVNVTGNAKFTPNKSLLDQLKDMKKSAKSEKSIAETENKVLKSTLSEVEMSQQIVYLGDGQNSEILYSINDSPQFVEESLPEDFFELSSNDLKHILAELRRQQVGETESQLETRKSREEREKSERERFEQTIIRVVLPYDRLVLQAIFKPTDTVQDVVEVIKRYAEDDGQNLYLFSTPPKTILPSTSTLFDLKLVPNGSIYCGSSVASQSPLIKEPFKTQISTFKAAFQLATRQLKVIYQKSKQNKL